MVLAGEVTEAYTAAHDAQGEAVLPPHARVIPPSDRQEVQSRQTEALLGTTHHTIHLQVCKDKTPGLGLLPISDSWRSSLSVVAISHDGCAPSAGPCSVFLPCLGASPQHAAHSRGGRVLALWPLAWPNRLFWFASTRNPLPPPRAPQLRGSADHEDRHQPPPSQSPRPMRSRVSRLPACQSILWPLSAKQAPWLARRVFCKPVPLQPGRQAQHEPRGHGVATRQNGRVLHLATADGCALGQSGRRASRGQGCKETHTCGDAGAGQGT